MKVKHSLPIVAVVLLISVGAARAAETVPAQLIGYTEFRTNLPGGRALSKIASPAWFENW